MSAISIRLRPDRRIMLVRCRDNNLFLSCDEKLKKLFLSGSFELVLDKRLQPGQRLVPLLGNEIEVLP